MLDAYAAADCRQTEARSAPLPSADLGYVVRLIDQSINYTFPTFCWTCSRKLCILSLASLDQFNSTPKASSFSLT